MLYFSIRKRAMNKKSIVLELLMLHNFLKVPYEVGFDPSVLRYFAYDFTYP